jgi:hypothetical protein
VGSQELPPWLQALSKCRVADLSARQVGAVSWAVGALAARTDDSVNEDFAMPAVELLSNIVDWRVSG